MTGKKLKLFAETLPTQEKIAIKKLCEPDWDYEITGIKHGPSGIMLIVSLYYCPFKSAPIYEDGEIRWLYDSEERPEDQKILSEYESYTQKYKEEMRPYPWRERILFGEEKEPILFLHRWLIYHDPEDGELSEEELLEREQVLKDLRKIDEELEYPDSLLEIEEKKPE